MAEIHVRQSLILHRDVSRLDLDLRSMAHILADANVDDGLGDMTRCSLNLSLTA
jgi:hypothetical protein